MKNTYYITLALALFVGYSHGMTRPLKKSQEVMVAKLIVTENTDRQQIEALNQYYDYLPGTNPHSRREASKGQGVSNNKAESESNELPKEVWEWVP